MQQQQRPVRLQHDVQSIQQLQVRYNETISILLCLYFLFMSRRFSASHSFFDFFPHFLCFSLVRAGRTTLGGARTAPTCSHIQAHPGHTCRLSLPSSHFLLHNIPPFFLPYLPCRLGGGMFCNVSDFLFFMFLLFINGWLAGIDVQPLFISCHSL